MPPADRSQSGLVSWLTALLHRLRVWTRREIVSDDPWDRGESLFADPPNDPLGKRSDKLADNPSEPDVAPSASTRREP